jgi:hypothetical protein
MLLVIACEISVRYGQIPPIDEILKMSTYESLSIVSCHAG